MIIIVNIQTVSGRARTVHRGRAITVTPTAKIIFMVMVTFGAGDKATIRTTCLKLVKKKEKVIEIEYTENTPK